MVKAIGLFSGGLDSIIAAKVLQKQGIDVEVLIFASPFFNRAKEECFAVKSAKMHDVPYKFVDLGMEFVDMVRNPVHGYGKHMNPCIDCKIFMLRKAKEYADKVKADFVFTGEVLGQRPKSQHKGALLIIEEDSGLKGRLLRPLCAKWMPETEVEKKGLVDRSKLLDIQGRQRKKQIELAKGYGIKEYSTPAGGCLLTEGDYSRKLRGLIDIKEPTENDIDLLKNGRAFRVKDCIVIVGKNQQDNEALERLKLDDDIMMEAVDVGSPLTLVRGPYDDEVISVAACLTARYSDSKSEKTKVKYDDKEISVPRLDDKKIEKIRM